MIWMQIGQRKSLSSWVGASASEQSGIDDAAGSDFTAGTKAPVDPSPIDLSEDRAVGGRAK